MKLKDIEAKEVDGVMDAVGSVIKAIVAVAKMFDSLKKKDEPTEK